MKQDLENAKQMKPEEEKLLRQDSDGYIPEPHLYELYDEPLPCFGCGIGWLCFLLGFVFPLLWYYATFLYLRRYSRKQPRERPGLAACAIAALICTVGALITTLAVLL
ncbi:large ribosomal subunit protein eL20z isoform X2 [Cryptomeria japonica]|uniref:large ribosomal subunit protein eL20z isoform X2 n=1 Tax=Cryptomeria japonica TaxID=3369 RepID=UPI0025ACCBB4|nr:large ribosomal subunit protein eL20z isoform X2 [Cryptomeria japonica]